VVTAAGASPGASPSAPAAAEGPPGGVWVGISGAPESTPRSGSAHAVERCRQLGLDALEMAWVHRVSMTENGAAAVRQAAERHGVRLSVHAPYYINLNSPDPDVVAASKKRIADAARAAAWCGARDVVLHLGFVHDDPPAVVLERMAAALSEVGAGLAREGVQVTLRPEVMGRASQFGDLEDVLALCREVKGLAPCIDIAHLHARGGAWNSRAEFDRLWDRVLAELGPGALADAHVHLSGIEYGDKGEVRHLPLGDSDLDHRGFLAVMAERGVGGSLVVESPAREADAVLVAQTWRELVARRGGGAPQP